MIITVSQRCHNISLFTPTNLVGYTGIIQVIHRNRFIVGTKRIGYARKAQRAGRLLGYMVTNFNHVSFEHRSTLEMMLDWFDSYTRIAAAPGALMDTLVRGTLALLKSCVQTTVMR
jgi:hypothetical protein